MSLSEHEGIIDPSVDDLLGKAESKYALVIMGARRARQINAYYSQLQEGLFEHVGPLVETDINEKSLSIAMREIDDDVVEAKHVPDAVFNENGQLLQENVPAADIFGSDFFSEDIEETTVPFVDFSESAAPAAEETQQTEETEGE